jgi:predicted small lipoprotein YifL
VNRALTINFAALALVGLAAGALGGCGRAGPLEPPPDAQAVAKQTSAADNNSGLPQPHQRPKPIEAPKQPFFLDPLL